MSFDPNTARPSGVDMLRNTLSQPPAKKPAFDPSSAKPVEEAGLLRRGADTLLAAGQGAIGATKAATDAFGADNAVSRGLGGAAEVLGGLESGERRAERAQTAAEMRAAEGDAVAEIGAALRGVARAPVATIAEGAGSILPTLVAARLGGGTVAGRTAAGTGMGAVQGAGAVKGSIYDTVRNEALAAGASEDEASAQAEAAQAYEGGNLDQIAAGAGLGALAAGTGVESAVQRVMGGQAAGAGMLRSTLMGAAKEGVTEGIQGGQERYAGNVAAGREGFEVDPFAGVAGQAALEGVVGGVLGGGAGAVEGYASGRAPQPVADPDAALRDTLAQGGPLSQAAAAAIDAGAVAQSRDAATVSGMLSDEVEQKSAGEATPEQSAADEVRVQLQRLEDGRMLAGMRADPKFGPQGANALLQSLAIARNPNVDLGQRLRAIDVARDAMDRFEGRMLAGTEQAAEDEFLRLAASENLTRNTRLRTRVPAKPRGEFAAVDELASLIQTERADVDRRRADIASGQALRRESELESAHARTAGQREQEARAARAQILDEVLSDPAVQNHRARFQAQMRRAGIRDSLPTPDEVARIDRFIELRDAQSDDNGVLPSAPNELDAAAMGIRERGSRQQPKRAPNGQAAEVDAAGNTGTSVVAGGSAGLAPDRTGVDAGGGASSPASARSSGAGVSVGVAGTEPAQELNAPTQGDLLASPESQDDGETRSTQGAAPGAQVPAEVGAQGVAVANAGTEPAKDPAHDAATSPTNNLPEPTEAQKDAGNYRKGHIKVGGLDVSIENPEGSQRSGTDPSGKPWSVTMRDHYGYIRGTRGRDKDHVDVFVKPGTPEDYAGPVVVINQNVGGKFDEHKAVVGYPNALAARRAYAANYAPGWAGDGGAVLMSMDEFKAWLDKGDMSKPASKPASKPREGGETTPVQDFLEGRRPDAPTLDEMRTPAPSANTIFTEDAAAKARELLRRKLGQVNTGLDPEILQAGITLAGYHIEKGARKFAAYARAMLDDMGDAVKPYLKSWYMGVKYDPRAAAFTGDMSSAAEVDAADVDTLPDERKDDGRRILSDEATASGDKEKGNDGDKPAVGARNPGASKAPGRGRGPHSQQPDARGHSEDVGGAQPEDVGAPAKGESRRPAGQGAAGPDVGPEARPDGRGLPDDRRAGSGGARNPDAGAGRGSGRPPAAGGQPAGVESSPASAGPGDFVITDPLRIVGGGQVARFEKNRAAIELRNRLIDEARKPTREEQEVLAGYTGWGSFGQELFKGSWAKPAPKQGWEARDRWLRDNLGQAEWEGMQNSIINAHYTDPPTVLAMWDMVRRMGFSGGRVLEPSIGIGNFFGMMPTDLSARSQRAGIELDPVTGSMAQMLYPQANIQIKGYEESTTPDNFYDLVIGNWPFFEQGPADRRYNKLSPTLHDYFFLKAIDQTRPGGLVVGITTHGTMDKKGVGARMEMARKAELVAAFRLPTGAFEEYAGTAVVTDIIILRKRDQRTEMVADEGWIDAKEYDTPEGTKVWVNEYFHRNPSHVIGQIDFGHGTTSPRPGLIVRRPDDMQSQLQRVVGLVPEGAYKADGARERLSYVANHTSDRTNALTKTKDGFFIVRGEYLAPANEESPYRVKSEKITAQRERQFDALIDMRKLYGQLIDAERAGEAEAQRKALREAYEAFVREHGPLSASYGLSYLERIDDPFYPSLASLETDGKPASILSRSTMRAAVRMENPSIEDAFVLARAEEISPSLERIAALAKKPADEVRAALVKSGAVFEMPNGDIEPSDIYLSGNVRNKLRWARAAFEEGNAAMARNIEALEEVLPPTVPYYKIETQLGATWVPPSAYEQYIAHMLGLKDTKGISVKFEGGAWKVGVDSALNNRNEASSGFGVKHVKFKRLVRAAIANQAITIKRKDENGSEYVDDEATKETAAAISEIRGRFGEWLWAEPTRRVELEAEYNEVRNAYATPKFDGSFLPFAGMALSLGKGPFNLRQHQVNAIWRGLVTRKSLNAHEVGTGKTFTMGGIAVESRRYGIARKPMILAHNANSKSVAHEIQQMYPAARVLYIDNLSPQNINVRMMQIANDDWDAVVVPHSLIDRLGFKKETLLAMAKEEIRDLEIAAEEAADEDGVSITGSMWDDEDELAKLRSPTAKQLVKQRMKIMATIEKQAQRASKEGAIAFEDLGVDMILVDEAHEFKKPPIATKMNMKGLQKSTSDQSIALMFMTKYIRGMNGGGNVHLFTGTPITNTMTEVFHMMRYIMQEEMQDAALADWDGWFGSFAREVQDVELNPAGEYEAVTRLQSFINVPELRRMIGQYMDVVFAEDMPEMQLRSVAGKRMTDPDLTADERREMFEGRTEGAADRPYKRIVNENSDMSEAQMSVFNKVRGYARAWKNMGKKDRKEAMSAGAPESPIIHEGIAARASFDVRLVDAVANAGKEGSPELAPEPSSKPARVLKNLLEIYRGHPQANQVVFMEQGISTKVTRSEGPVGKKKPVTYPAFSTARDMIERLVQAGVPREQIALVDGSTSKDKRKEIADAMNDGRVRIVFGSTASLGVGVNMQRNLRAMHHMDAPWMPGELEQRNGRGHRQGNQWNTVLEFRYLTDRLDGRRWQVLAIKQKFITAFMKAKDDVRVIEGDAADDSGGDILSTFSEAAGDPRILLREKFKKKLEHLQSRQRIHSRAVADAQYTVKRTREDIAKKTSRLEELRAAGTFKAIADVLESMSGDRFRVMVGGKPFDKRADAQAALVKWLTENVRKGDEAKKVAEYGGVDVMVDWERRWADEPRLTMMFKGGVQVDASPTWQSLEASLRRGRDTLEPWYEKEIAEAREASKHAEKVSAEPFHLQAELDNAAKRLAELVEDIERNPVAPPHWLRAGAPADTDVVYRGKTFVVSGHRWTDEGWFVVAQDERGEISIPYMEARDAQGMPLYEEREFEPPSSVMIQDSPAAPPVAEEPDAAYTAGYETDLFGNELPQTARKAQSRARRPAASAGNVQPAPAVSGDTPAPAADYYARTVVGVTQNRALGASVIRTPADLAKATAYLYKSAVERFDAVVTDAEGRALAVVGAFKGALAQTSIYPATVVAEAVRVPGAAHIWFSHNHPSGLAELSRADVLLAGSLARVFDGSGIKPMGLMAVSKGRYAFVNGNDFDTGEIPPAGRAVSVPVVERELIPSEPGPSISDPGVAMEHARGFVAASGGPGVILMDMQNRVRGWLPIRAEITGPLKDTGGLWSVYRAISESNAGAAILAHSGELDARVGAGISVAQNIAAAFQGVDVKVLDIIDVKRGVSVAQQSGNVAASTVLSRTMPRGGARIALRDLQAVAGLYRKAYPRTPVTVVEDEDQLPKALRDQIRAMGAEGEVGGLYHNGNIYLVRSGIADVAHAEFTVMHEGTHAGMHGLFGAELDMQMVALYRANENLRKMADSQIERFGYDVATATNEALADMGGDMVRLTGWRRFVAWMRSKLRKLGFVRTWTDDDVAALVVAARYYNVRRGSAVSGGDAMLAQVEGSPVAQAMQKYTPEVVGRQLAERVVAAGGRYEVGGMVFEAVFDAPYPGIEITTAQGHDVGKIEGRSVEDVADGLSDLLAEDEELMRAVRARLRAGEAGLSVVPRALFSRSLPASRVQAGARTIADAAGVFREAAKVLREPSAKTFGWASNVRTQLDKAMQDPKGFGRVFNLMMGFENDLRRSAARPAEMAQSIIPLDLEGAREAAKRVLQGRRAKANMERVSEVLFEGTLSGADVTKGRVFSPEELEDRGLTPAQRDMYFEARNAIDASLDEAAAALAYAQARKYVPRVKDAIRDNPTTARYIINDALDDLAEQMDYQMDDEGIAQIAAARASIAAVFKRADELKAAGYAPLMRFGRYTVTGYDDEGAVAYFARFDTEFEAKKAEAWARGEGFARVVRGVAATEGHKLFAGIDPETVAMFIDHIGDRYGDDAIDHAVLQEWYRNAVGERSAWKRLIHRKGTPGFDTDLERVLSSFLTSQARFAAQMYNRADVGAALRELADDKARGDVLDEAVRLTEYMNNPADPFAGVKSLLFGWFLGGSISSAAVNLTQPVMMTFPYLSQWGAGRAFSALTGAAREAATGRVADPELSRALVKAQEQGIVDTQEIHNLWRAGIRGGLSRIPGGPDLKARMEGVASLWGFMFGAVEKINRRITFIAAYRMAKSNAKLGDPFKFAVRAVNETQGIYSKANRPNWARGTGTFGAVGAAAFTFKQYSIAYIELLNRMWKSGPEGRRAALLMLGLLLLASGAQGLPGAEDAEDILDTVLQFAGETGNTREDLRDAAFSVLGQDLGAFALYGVTAFLPLDIQSRLGLGNLLPATALFKPSEENRARVLAEFAGPTGSLLSSVTDAASAAEAGQGVGGIMRALLPVGLKNAAKGYDMAETGMYRDYRGRKVVETDGADAFIKGVLGFQPTDVSMETRSLQIAQQNITRVRKKESDIAELMARARFEGDADLMREAQEQLSEWNRNNPNLPIRIDPSQILRRVREMNKTRRERVQKMAPKEVRSLVLPDS